jgi:gamma-glutamylcysteine synthetase
MKHYYIKAVGDERKEASEKITSIQFNDFSSDENKDKIQVSVELKGEIVAVFAIYKDELKNASEWLK